MNSIFKCKKCRAEFSNDEEHQPRILRCGHTFCKRCVSENFKCWTCETPSKVTFKRMIINRALIPPLENAENETLNSNEIYPCQTHKRELQYFCSDCKDLACWECTRNVHRDHRVEPLVDIANNKCATEAKEKIHNEIQALSNSCLSQFSFSQDMLGVIDEIAKCRSAFEDYKKSLQDCLRYTTQGLNTLDSLHSNSSEENTKKLTEIIYQREKFDIPQNPTSTETCATLDHLWNKLLKLKDELQKLSSAHQESSSSASEDGAAIPSTSRDAS